MSTFGAAKPNTVALTTCASSEPTSASIAFESLNRLIAAALYEQGVAHITKSGLQAISAAVGSFMIKLARNTREEAETSRRGASNLFDVCCALDAANPCLCAQLLSSSSDRLPTPGDTVLVARDCLSLIRPFSNDHVVLPAEETEATKWKEIGETDVDDPSDQRFDRQRLRWEYVTREDQKFLLTGQSDKVEEDASEPPSSLEQIGHLLPYMPPLPPATLRLKPLAEKQITSQSHVIRRKRRRTLSLEDLLHVQLLLPKVIEQESEIVEAGDYGTINEREEISKFDKSDDGGEQQLMQYPSEICATRSDSNLFLMNDSNQ